MSKTIWTSSKSSVLRTEGQNVVMFRTCNELWVCLRHSMALCTEEAVFEPLSEHRRVVPLRGQWLIEMKGQTLLLNTNVGGTTVSHEPIEESL